MPTHYTVPDVGSVIAAAFAPQIAMVNDFNRALRHDPGVLTNPIKYMQAAQHAWMVGCAAALWGQKR